jgi:molybdenum cofactor cytidylyltransferase
MLGANKLLQSVRGQALIRHAVNAALGATLAPVIVVTGHEAERVKLSLTGVAVEFIHNPLYAEGLASSLRRGIDALQMFPEVTGACVLLADMPDVHAGHLHELSAPFHRLAGRRIIVPTYQGRWGNPLIWSADFFSQILALQGDRGARALAEENASVVYEVAMNDDAVLRDLDTTESFSTLPP